MITFYNNIKRIIVLSIVSLACVQLYAQSVESSEPYIGKRHRGFYLSLGFGSNQTNVTVDSKNFGYSTFKGSGIGMDIKIGGALAENLILHATILSHGATGPTVESDYWGFEELKTDNNVNISEGLVGGGLTYYIPENFFLSTSLGYGGFTFVNKREDFDVTTSNGLSYQIKAGKEWWVSPKWGIGLALYYHNTNCLNQAGYYAEERIKSHNFGILLNATLNGRKNFNLQSKEE